MNGIDRLSSTVPLALAGASAGAGTVARQMMAAAGAGVIGWAADSFRLGPATGAAWTAATGAAIPAADRSLLSRGGDVYGLREIAGSAARQLGATPAEEGRLLRALEDFTRAAALNVNALAGTGATMLSALDAGPLAPGDGEGLDGVVARLELATQRLDAANR